MHPDWGRFWEPTLIHVLKVNVVEKCFYIGFQSIQPDCLPMSCSGGGRKGPVALVGVTVVNLDVGRNVGLGVRLTG